MKETAFKRIRAALVVGVCIAAIAAVVFLKTAYVVPILMYHSIDGDEGKTKLSVAPDNFASQMEFLHRKRYNVVGLDKIISYMQKKEKIPPRTVAITFDDGYLNNYTSAYPVLKKYKLPATIFIITDKIGQKGWCGWRELKEMSDSGLITIGSHTKSHAWLPDQGDGKLKEELEASKAVLEKGLGRKVDFLCYPLGAHDERVKKAVKEAGYAAAVATNPGKSKPNDDIYAIKRIKISRTSRSHLVFWGETSGYYTSKKERKDDYTDTHSRSQLGRGRDILDAFHKGGTGSVP
jgi:peptidoglycan/xylan/chitin deacetylase (PgdA/CDA1 family)